MKVLVIGGTGQVGSLVSKELLKRGAEVRAFCRKPSKVLPPEIEIVNGDLLDPSSVEKAMDGVDKVYLMNAAPPEELVEGIIAFDVARQVGVKHIVYQSVFGAEKFKDVPHLHAKLAIENAIREFDVPYTILRPNYFMQNDVMFKDALLQGGVYPAPLGEIAISMVDIHDIAEAAATALMSDDYFGKTYNLIGPEELTGSQIASIWSGLLGREIGYTGDELEPFFQTMQKQAAPWFAYDLKMMVLGYLERGFSADPKDVETLTKLLGHSPRRYEDFARDVAKGWKVEKAA